ncbi:cell surface glycoprotein CD200 receptor 1-A-like isoform X2 [Xyrichtys novacula]|uniref:Cell surface glycoprotein CD200 receptor 1-A-like isoform X2 n=1 Tax=Xyrichtys novacula TaxID=13765 RepID=A0AAV1H0K7_XYRNO|nr:cell surface glycoprotein CD200 receptor 1-A-like isoform X2 [Xyrichtys novacula]
MRDVMWICAMIILSLSEAWSQNPVVRNLSVNLGTDVNLTCSNKTWDETLFVTWNIFKNKAKNPCMISFIPGGKRVDSCKDGKSLRNTSLSQSYLHIPNFSKDDVGDYNCHSPYKGGSVDVVINLNVTVPPKLLIWLERKGNWSVVVCKAERGNPAANISWSPVGNSSFDKTLDSQGLYTVESRLVLPKGADANNLSCVIKHPCLEEELFLQDGKKGEVPWLIILFVVIISILLVGCLFVAQKQLGILRRCQRSDSDLSTSKSQTTEDVEEVEPYASYIQRVNSIYNSSAVLYT